MRKIWPWEVPEDVELSNGVIMRMVSVPPYAYADVHAEYSPPPSPMVELESRGGGTETARALPGSPEWEAWVEARSVYRRKAAQRTGAFALDYACLGWKYPGGVQAWPEGIGPYAADGEGFFGMPPEEWVPPAIMQSWGVEINMEDAKIAKLSFIKYILIRTDDDETKVSGMIDGKRPPIKKEVEAAAVPFDSSDQMEVT